MPLSRLLLAAALFLGTAALTAQSGRAQPANIGPWGGAFRLGTVAQTPAGLDGGGSFSVNRTFIEPSYGYAWDRDTTLGFAVGLGQSRYDFSDSVNGGGAQPWERIDDLRLSGVLRFKPTDSTSAIIIPSIRANYETGAELKDATTYGAIAGISWDLGPSLRIGPGFGAFSEIGGGTSLFPILLLDWDITDRLNFGTGGGLAASQGPGLALNYSVNDDWTVGVGGRYEKIRFRLNDRGPAPGGIGEDESFPLFLTVERALWPTAAISFVAGAELNGRLRLEDSAGNLVDEQEYETAPFFGLTFRTRF
ncbi:hypothetical protein [Oceanomicrobium pacificus]|uniref:Outer membrane protein beta-barrel domain-containing protein n=1 Tax=Oceanomicrobium pacificus TaxID=2692916 RepID=A0A6B0TSQ5_9RHOB|nr:hypothetical protein [Oceanomicrobium pacificus]MXU64242.1 hypothetical protein [Oceanomicrobium pacificus]